MKGRGSAEELQSLEKNTFKQEEEYTDTGKTNRGYLIRMKAEASRNEKLECCRNGAAGISCAFWGQKSAPSP